MKRSSLVAALAISLLLPSLAAANPEALHPLPQPLAPTPTQLLSDQGRLDLLPAELRAPTLLAHARRRKVIGRSLTLAGVGALVIAFGVGMPLMFEGDYGQSVAGIALTSIFGALGGSAVTVGPILWQLGAGAEKQLRDGTYDLSASVQRRRVAGGVLVGIGVLGEVAALIGGYLIAANTHLNDESGQATGDANVDLGVDLALIGSAVAVLGCTMGGTLITTAGGDAKLQMSLSLAPGGLRMTF